MPRKNYAPDTNFVVKNEHWDEETEALLFAPESVAYLDPGTDIWDLLVRLEMFESKSQARKNWTRTGRDIPLGFTELRLKQKTWAHCGDLLVCVWVPVPEAAS